MEKTLYIKVAEALSELLNTREAATMLFHLIEKHSSNRVEFDFSEVEFMSRSFADQFHKERSNIKKENGLVIVISNANEEVQTILKTVAQTQNKSKRAYMKLPVFQYTNTEMLSDYLLSI
jgi:anti-anti-sigma regulatory factor